MINKFTKVLIISGDYVELHVTEEVKVSLPVKQLVGHAKVTMYLHQVMCYLYFNQMTDLLMV
jgi:hypothetical protein